MKLKHCTLSSVLICLSIAVLSLAAGCDDSRDPRSGERVVRGLFKVEAWNEHLHYYAGERVHMRATLTNISEKTQVWGNTKGATAVLDLDVTTPKQLDGSIEAHNWSQEHPDEVKYSVTLEPDQSYGITWEFTPTLLTMYNAAAKFNLGGEDNWIPLSFVYGINPSGPGP